MEQFDASGDQVSEQDSGEKVAVVVTMPDVYRELTSLSGEFRAFIATYNERELHRSRHEERLQSLERFKVAVIASVVMSLGSAASTIATLLQG